MSNTPKDKADIGVLVGRFQVNQLHDGHIALLESVLKHHKKVVVFLGVAPGLVTRNNPLDFVARKEMILQSFPQVTVLSIPDMPSDKEWSKTLDERIKEVAGVSSVLLYGGRGGFIERYFGAFPTKELGEFGGSSGTEVRKEVSAEVKASADFRAGVIYAAYNQYPKVFPTVDVAIFKGDDLLLGRKAHQDKFRFLGGFTDPTDNSYEHAARRETMEEVGIEIDGITYIGSAKIDDWRYRSEVDKIITLFFKAEYQFGNITPQDDITEARFFKFDRLTTNDIVAEHQPLFDMLVSYMNRKKQTQPGKDTRATTR